MSCYCDFSISVIIKLDWLKLEMVASSILLLTQVALGTLSPSLLIIQSHKLLRISITTTIFSKFVTFDKILHICGNHTWCILFLEINGNRWIGREGPIAWLPCSPDLTALDFHFWGYMETVVYEGPVETQQDLVTGIQLAAGVMYDMPGIFPRVRHDIIRRYTLYRV